MIHFTAILRHPLFGFQVVEFGSFDKVRARILATKSIGTGYKLVSMKEHK